MPAAICERPMSSRPEVKELPTAEAFLLMKVKRGNNIGCLSTPLKLAPTPQQAKDIITGVLGTDPKGMYVSEHSNLFFQTTPGLYKGLDRFFDVPEKVLGISMESKRREFERETSDQFFDSVSGRTFDHAGAGKGGETFPFGYKIEDGHVVGKTLKGEKRQIVTLAIDYEHKNLLQVEDKAFVEGPDELTSIEISAHPTVTLCCAKFFKEKFLEKLTKVHDAAAEAIGNIVSLFFGPEYAHAMLEENSKKQPECKTCGQSQKNCNGHQK